MVIDTDLNNSVSSYYLNEQTKEQIGTKNIAVALSNATNNLQDYVLPTVRENLFLIPSSLYLVDLRGLSERRFKTLLPSLENNYDFVIVDTQPTYDNLVLNAYYAADFIITPIQLSLFDYNTAAFLEAKLKLETDKYPNWYITVNGYNQRYQSATGGNQKEYLELFKERFANFTPEASWFPWTPKVRTIIDRKMVLKGSESNIVQNCIESPELLSSILSLADCFLEEGENLPYIKEI